MDNWQQAAVAEQTDQYTSLDELLRHPNATARTHDGKEKEYAEKHVKKTKDTEYKWGSKDIRKHLIRTA